VNGVRARPPAATAGIGLRASHYREVAERLPAIGLLEVHSENFFGDGGPALAWLERLRRDYPLSLHGVGLSLGSVDPLDRRHLARLRALIERFEPAIVSEHLAWSSWGGRHANDLLPLPFTREAADHLVARIGETEEALGRAILVENVSSYMTFAESTLAEADFVTEVARRAGCGILLDVNNVHVNATNHGFEAGAYIDAIVPELVGEMHLAGFERDGALLIDTHAARIAPAVWELYQRAADRIGARPTVVEWDADIPALDVLLDEASKARAILERTAARPAEIEGVA
jgi:uncharacterized protein (UPF0276 family)